MTSANFLLEFQLNVSEIKQLNKMYFKHLFKERIVFCMVALLTAVVGIDFILESDFLQWLISSLALVVVFIIIQFCCINTISDMIFELSKRLLKFDKFHNKYKLIFTYSDISVHSPLGALTHKWSKIEKVISTKDALFLYIKERNGYIISISKKEYHCQKIEELLAFVESNIITVTKI
ncbi:YcxB family protein [Flavobacterium sp. ACN6]|uniref:YcxB family protein n=1 Tax=Flavobacterium sp. ACN6 TaxID=1920426 RepID=UPI000BB2CEE5|nr:YcxB family protein [Flavobacterium sp. ACN6]PBJ04387.1 hypothetical protein BSF42_44420 [Flavobacterium sp. ACN6]